MISQQNVCNSHSGLESFLSPTRSLALLRAAATPHTSSGLLLHPTMYSMRGTPVSLSKSLFRTPASSTFRTSATPITFQRHFSKTPATMGYAPDGTQEGPDTLYTYFDMVSHPQSLIYQGVTRKNNADLPRPGLALSWMQTISLQRRLKVCFYSLPPNPYASCLSILFFFSSPQASCKCLGLLLIS